MHPVPNDVNASSVTSIDLLSANEMQDMAALNFFFLEGKGGLPCTSEESCESVGPPNASLRLRLLASPFGQRLIQSKLS